MTKNKGIEDCLDIHLTPKDWGIRLIEVMRGYSIFEFREAYTMEAIPLEENTSIFFDKPSQALANQAKARFPGEDAKSVERCEKETKRLLSEFEILRMLIFTINSQFINEIAVRGLMVSAKLSRVETAILLDAFKRTADKAISWVRNYPPANTEEKESRERMLKELAAYTEVNFAESFSDSLPLGGSITLRTPSVLEEEIVVIKDLLGQTLSYQYALELIQKEYFDGTDILIKDNRKELRELEEFVRSNVETYINYLETRQRYFGAQWAQEEVKDGISSAIPGEQEGQLFIDLGHVEATARNKAKTLARTFVKEAKREVALQQANVAKVWDLAEMLEFIKAAHSRKDREDER
jgi:hypothetical protein